MLSDKRGAEEVSEELYYEGGLEAFVQYLDRTKAALIESPIYLKSEKDGNSVEAALWWNDSYHENVLSPTIFPSAMAAPIWPDFAAHSPGR